MATTTASMNNRKRPEEDCQVTSFQALQTALKHPSISSDEKTVCSLLQTCKSWRAALQQCAAGNLHVSVGCTSLSGCMNSIQKLALFSGWLQQQAGLVSSITFGSPFLTGLKTQDAYLDAAEQVLVLGFQAAGRQGAATGTAAAAALAGLQLRSCSAYIVRSPALLCALPAASLTQLVLHRANTWRSSLDLNSSSITAAVSQLGGLRSLELSGSVGGDCVAAVGQLALLTQLRINCVRCPAGDSCDLQQLPQQLQQLHLSVRNEGGTVRVALGQLTALQNLSLFAHYSTAAGSSLPTSLTALTLWVSGATGAAAGSVQRWNISTLPQLQQLHASNLQRADLLALLSTNTALTHLDLSYEGMTAVEAAAVWRQVPTLHALHLDEGDGILDPMQSLLLLQGLAAATSLTELTFEGQVVHESVQLCAHLTGLTRLLELEVDGSGPASRADALHLTALTSLTRLDLSEATGVDDTAASALALRLTRLQQLRLSDCGLRSAAALPSIATLTGLTCLCLGADGSSSSDASELPLGRDELLLLAPLVHLKKLDCCDFFSGDATNELWDAALQRWRPQ